MAKPLKHSRDLLWMSSLVQVTHRSTQGFGDYAVEIYDGDLTLTQIAHQRRSLWAPGIIGNEKRD